MAKIQILICALFSVIAIASTEIKQSGSIDEVFLVNSIEDYIKANPNVNVTPMEKEVQSVKSRNFKPMHYVYKMGVSRGNARILEIARNKHYYPTLQDVKLQLTYPRSGIGAIVTFVQISVHQSSNNGKANIVAGRIGERFIRIIVEASETSYFNYTATFYGY